MIAPIEKKEQKKLLVFHQALAPYRVDFWNHLNRNFNLELYLIYSNLLEQKFNQDSLKNSLEFDCKYHQKGFRIKNTAIRWGFRNLIKKHNPDIVFSYEYSQSTFFLYLLKKILGFKYKLYIICDDSLQFAQNCRGIRRFMRNYLITKIDGIIVVNNDVSNWYSQNFKLKSTPIVFPIIRDESLFTKKLEAAIPLANKLIADYKLDKKKILLFVGRLVELKGIDRVLRAFQKCLINPNNNNFCFVIIGEGEKQAQWENLVNELNIADHVIFVGRQEDNALNAWYNIGQVFILNSHWEAFGAVVNEALISGQKVICSSMAGASAIVKNDINGSVIDPYNIDLLASEIERHLTVTNTILDIKQVRPSLMIDSFTSNCINLTKSLYKKDKQA